MDLGCYVGSSLKLGIAKPQQGVCTLCDTYMMRLMALARCPTPLSP